MDDKEQKMSEEKPEEQDIPWALLFGIAGLLDLLSFLWNLVTLIPFVGWVLGPSIDFAVSTISGLSFWLYFLGKGHNFWKGALGTTISEIIPLWDMVPTWIAYVGGVYLKIKGEQLPAGQSLGLAAKIATKII